MHPDCATPGPTTGGMIAAVPMMGLLAHFGYGLSTTKGPVSVVVEGRGTWYANDSNYAFTWAKAARRLGLTVNVYVQ